MKPLPKQSDVLACTSVYGNPKGNRPDQASVAWQRANLVRLVPPFTMTYAGTPIKSMAIHKYCKEHFEHFLELVRGAAERKQSTLDFWGVSRFGGSFNYRLMRGGNVLSMHSFGCAIDLDPARNALKDSTPRFLEFPALVDAIRKSELVWGADWNGDGQTADTRTWDGMHFQATQPL